MKKLLILSALTCALFACSKSNSYEFTFDLDGQNYSFNEEASYAMNSSVSNGKYFIHLVGKESATDFTLPDISLHVYYMADSLGKAQKFDSSLDIALRNFDGKNYLGNLSKPNQYVLTTVDFDKELIEGTFECIVKDTENNEKSITNGKFKLQLYKGSN